MDGLVEIFLLFGVLFYLFNTRGSSMVDVLSTRLQEVYARWEARTEIKRNPESTSRYSIDELRRTGQHFYRKKIQDREQARKFRENNLFKIKETEPLTPFVKNKSSFLHYCCNFCTPASRSSLVNTISKQLMPYGLNILIVNPGLSLFSKVFCCISHVYSRKEYDYPRITQTVLEDERLKDAIKLNAWESISDDCNEKECLAKAKARAKSILLQMEAKTSNFLLKITAWLLYKLLPCFITSAVVQPSQIEILKQANESGLPLILLPLHRSHLDYIMTTLILLLNDIRTPLIAAGDNLKIPFFGRILRSLGAFFIKRRIDPVVGRKDVLYRATLHTYIMESLRAGHNIEVFIEGGRTRTGKPCMPKGGILSVILDAYMDGIIEDALLIPVAINYDRLVDGNFVREQLGQPKKMETFGSTIKAIWSTLRGDYGIIKVDFCQPFSLREMVKYFQNQQNKLTVGKKVPPAEKSLKSTMSSSSLYGTDVILEEYRQLVDIIARHVIHDCTSSMPIMSTNVVAFLLLYKFRDGCTLDKLVQAFDAMRQDLEIRDKDIAFCGETLDIVNHAIDILGPGLIKKQHQEVTEAVDGQLVKSNFVTAIRPISILPNVIELSYYSNTLLTCYVMDSIVVTALYAELKSQINDPIAIAQNDITVSRELLIERSLELCEVLKYEFIFCKPCQELERVVMDAIENLSHSDLISLEEEGHLEEELWSKRFAQKFDDSSDEEYQNDKKIKNIKYKVNLTPEYSERMEFLHALLRPLVDTYTFSAYTLRNLVGRSLTEKDLIHEVLNELKTNLDRDIVNYGESLCVDPIKNSLKLFEKWNVLECHSQENVKVFYLKDEYDNEPIVTKIYEAIAVFKWTRNVN